MDTAYNLEDRYRQIARLWSDQNWEAWSTTVAPNYRFDPQLGQALDITQTLAWSRAIFTAFPDYWQEVTEVFTGTGSVVGVARAKGTHEGTLDLGFGMSLPPTGKRFEIVYAKVLRFDERQLVVSDDQFLDAGELLSQLMP